MAHYRVCTASLFPVSYYLEQKCNVIICARISYCSLSLSGAITKSHTSCKNRHGHDLRFLFMRGLSTVLLAGRLGVEDRMTSANPRSCSVWFTFVGLGQIGSVPVLTSIWQNWLKKKVPLFYHGISWLLGGNWELLSPCLHGCTKC
jgi:hypothetical protein